MVYWVNVRRLSGGCPQRRGKLNNLYWGTLETHLIIFTVSSTWLIWGCFLYHFNPLAQWTMICHNFDLLMLFILTQYRCKCFFNNCRLTNVKFIQFENKHFEIVARCLLMEKHKMFQKYSLYYTPTRSVSFLTSVLKFQAAITGGWRLRMSRYFCILCNWLGIICWQ